MSDAPSKKEGDVICRPSKVTHRPVEPEGLGEVMARARFDGVVDAARERIAKLRRDLDIEAMMADDERARAIAAEEQLRAAQARIAELEAEVDRLTLLAFDVSADYAEALAAIKQTNILLERALGRREDQPDDLRSL